MVVGFGRGPAGANYAGRMANWRDERVRAAEEALRVAVRTADDILRSDSPPPLPDPADEQSVLRDAW
jgi:hypothetical protein